jgi:hypothetical protein
LFAEVLSYFENHGNDVIERDNQATLGAYKSWVDHAITLPAGELRNFSVYIHDKHEIPIPFRFQLWEVTDASRRQYRLVIQRRVVLPGVKGVKEVIKKTSEVCEYVITEYIKCVRVTIENYKKGMT